MGAGVAGLVGRSRRPIFRRRDEGHQAELLDNSGQRFDRRTQADAGDPDQCPRAARNWLLTGCRSAGKGHPGRFLFSLTRPATCSSCIPGGGSRLICRTPDSVSDPGPPEGQGAASRVYRPCTPTPGRVKGEPVRLVPPGRRNGSRQW
jgi:hypothetical protein